MVRISVNRKIAAPVETVFATISDIKIFSRAVPEIASFEFLSECEKGKGTRFRETRETDGKTMVTELEVTEFVENQRVRMVADSHGTIWDTLFVVKNADGGTMLEVTMDARAHKFLSRLINPLMKNLFRKGVAKNMDDVKIFCENQ